MLCVFITIMLSNKLLTCPYNGPFRVLRHFDKHFTLDINGKTKEVTVDCLKPAKFIGDSGAVELPAAVSAPYSPTLPAHRENASTPHQVPSHPPTTTRAGYLSRRPAHLSDYLRLVGGYCGDLQHSLCDISRTLLHYQVTFSS